MARNALFVGRERELAALTELRKDTARGPRFVLVGGEAGVGKSRLLAEFRRTLPQRAIVFGVGECADVVPAPFAPFIEMFTPFAPEIARRLTGAPIVTHGEAAMRALFDDVRHALEELAAKRALLLYLEDVHFADSGTLALLAHLARACQGPRLLAIVTYRVEALDQSDEFVATIARLVRLPNVTAIDLPPLSQRDARALVTGTIRADLAADARLVDALVARADGNAFFLEELVAHAAERSGDEAAPLPRSVSAVIRERFGTLPASDRTLLTHAAVFGRGFDIELLRKVVDAERDELLAALRRARDAGLVVEEPGDAQRLRFRHALTREAIVSGLLTLQRRPLHARILVVLEVLSADERDAYGSELAYHALEAHDPDKALRYGEAAGDKAVGIHGYADAAYQYRRALNAGPLPDATRRRLLRKLGDSLYWNRSAHDARRAYGEALDLARAAGDVEDAGTIQLQIARQHYMHGNTSEAIATAMSAIEILSHGGSQALRDVAAARLALYHAFRLETADALRLLATIVRPDAPDVAPLYHQARSGAYAFDFNFAAWQDEAALYLAAAERGGEIALAVALHNVADVAVATGEMRLAEQWLRRSLELGRRNAASGYFAFITTSGLAYQRYLAGELAEAKRLAESALSDASGWAMSDMTSTAAAIWAGLALGDDAFADAAYSEELVEIALASRQSQNLANVVGASADLLAERGRFGEARRLLRQALERIEHPLLCETFLFVAARHAAESDLARVSEIAGHPSRPRSHPLCAATIALVEALIDVRYGREEQARQHAGVAAAHFRTIGWKPFEAEALELAGEAAAATELYRAMGHVRALRRLAAKEVRAPPSGAIGSAALLSRREREIAALVAAGKPNRAIAQILGIAEKTVEQHLSSAFAKLEVSSRAQLVAALTEATAQPHDRAT
jgi:DNA-binding CsgD family transcriptional regulator/ABC-type transporter Mla MlaB component